MGFKEELDKIDLDSVSEEEAEKLKEDIVALSELEILCAVDCNCEESCAVDIKRAMEEEYYKSNSDIEEYKKTPKGEIETWRKEKANNALKNGDGIFYNAGHRGKGFVSPGGSVGLEDFEKKFKDYVKYRNNVKEKFRGILYKYGRECFEFPIMNAEDLPIDHSKTKIKLVKPYCDSLIELYFDPAFESKTLPKALVDEIFNGGKFNLTYIKSNDRYGMVHTGDSNLTEEPMVINLLNGLVSNFSKESKLAMDTFTDEQVKEHIQDILAFAELETVCSSDCDCEESCAADIDFEVKINNDHRLKAFVENNYYDYKKLVDECEKNDINQESLVNFIAMLSVNHNLKSVFDRLCACEYKFYSDKAYIKELNNSSKEFVVVKNEMSFEPSDNICVEDLSVKYVSVKDMLNVIKDTDN